MIESRQKTMQTFFNLLRFVVIFASGLSLNAKILFVDDNASAGGNGLLWANAFNHLQDALSAATSGDEIWVAEGIYLPDQGSAQKQGDRMATFNLVNGVGLFGGFEGNESKREPKGDSNQTILSGEIDVNSTDWSIHVLSAVGLDKSSILQGFRVVNGYADQSESPHNRGGGMYIENGSPVIRGCSFVGNSAKEQGGAIYNASANSSFIDCNFSGNLAGLEGKNGYGGAMSHANSTPMLTNCVFSENNATYQGGGLWGIQMNGTISDSVFVANIVTGNGGGVFLINSSPSFSNCVFVGNFADYGAGSYQESASTVFHNNVFTENNATYRGGGLFFYKSTTTLNNCNVVTNYAGLEGGGLGISKLSSKIPTLNNSILWKNLSSGTESHGVTGDWNGSVSYPSIFQGWTGDNRAVATDPLFSNVSNPNGLDGIWFTKDDGFRLQTGSPAIDFGTETLNAPRYDLAGFVRVQNGKIDLGAYEYGDQLMVLHTVSLFSSPLDIGVLSGSGIFEENSTQSISAVPQLGYLFQSWTGDANGTANPTAVLVDRDRNVTANFIKDLNDTDGDGLTNYDELVIHGSRVDSNDSDNDTLLDMEEVGIGSNPAVSDLHIVEFLSKDMPQKIALAKSEGNATGIIYVQTNPAEFNLYTATELNASNQSAQLAGRNEGQNMVTASPLSYNLIEKNAYDQVAEELRIYKMVYIWKDYDNFSQNSLDPVQWEQSWWKGSQPANVSAGKMILGGSGLLHSTASKNPRGAAALDTNTSFEGSVVKSPTMHSFAEVTGQGVYGVEGRMLIPSGSPVGTGIALRAIQFEAGKTQNKFGVELAYRDESSNKPQIKFSYQDPASGEEINIIRAGEMDAQYRVSVIHTHEKNVVYMNDELIFKFPSTWTPNWFGFYGFMDKDAVWVPYRTEVDDVRVLTPQTTSEISATPATPYTEGWFFVPDHGWLYTTRTIYPYFYDAATNDWLYFMSGNNLPLFYHFGSKSWIEWAKFTEGISSSSPVDGELVVKKEEPSYIQLSAINNSSKTHYSESASNLEMIWIEPGSFMMGSAENESNRAVNETQHDVNVTKGFYLGKYEVTQSQYEAVMTDNNESISIAPSRYTGPRRPVEKVSWAEANAFCARLTHLEQIAGRLPTGWKYSLPTESEWEYACRAGTTSSYSWGESISSANANYIKNVGQTTIVGQYPSNPWGFHDMNGNVWEWTEDWYDSNYKTSVGSDFIENGVTSTKSIRGGGWSDPPEDIRSASRLGMVPTGRYNVLGFRLCLRSI
jgi:formylglycine-generating enzyme required for sulfatase activity